MNQPFGGSVTIRRRTRGAPDEYGNDTWTTVDETVDGCAWWPRDGNGTSGNEDTSGRDTVIVGIALVLPYGKALSAVDQAIVGGDAYEVEGDPGYWRSPLTGAEFGTVVSLKRVTG